MSLIRSHILVCTGTGCTSSESPKIIAEFEKQLAAQGMDKEAQVVRTGCFGLCALGPIVTIYPEGVLHPRDGGRRGGDCGRAHRQGPHRQAPAQQERGGRRPGHLPGRDPVLQAPAPHRPAQLRRHQPGEHRRVHRRGRLRRPGQNPHRTHSAPAGHRHGAGLRPAGGAARASPRAKSGSSPPTR